jgi:hypothetical protein
MQIFCNNSILEAILQNNDCGFSKCNNLRFLHGELTKTCQSITLQKKLNKYNFKLFNKKIIFVTDTKIDHM